MHYQILSIVCNHVLDQITVVCIGRSPDLDPGNFGLEFSTTVFIHKGHPGPAALWVEKCPETDKGDRDLDASSP